MIEIAGVHWFYWLFVNGEINAEGLTPKWWNLIYGYKTKSAISSVTYFCNWKLSYNFSKGFLQEIKMDDSQMFVHLFQAHNWIEMQNIFARHFLMRILDIVAESSV